MKFSADSSFLLRLYLQGDATEVTAIEKFLTDGNKLISMSDIVRIEVLNILMRDPIRARQFTDDLAEGERLQLENLPWPKVFLQAESLAQRFSKALKPGGSDLLIVAASVTMGATWFLSFDRNSRQRPLAAAAGMKVWPPLDKEEKGLAKVSSLIP